MKILKRIHSNPPIKRDSESSNSRALCGIQLLVFLEINKMFLKHFFPNDCIDAFQCAAPDCVVLVVCSAIATSFEIKLKPVVGSKLSTPYRTIVAVNTSSPFRILLCYECTLMCVCVCSCTDRHLHAAGIIHLWYAHF